MRLNINVIVCVEYLSPEVAAVLFELVYDNRSAIVSALISRVSFDWLLWVTFCIFP